MKKYVSEEMYNVLKDCPVFYPIRDLDEDRRGEIVRLLQKSDVNINCIDNWIIPKDSEGNITIDSNGNVSAFRVYGWEFDESPISELLPELQKMNCFKDSNGKVPSIYVEYDFKVFNYAYENYLGENEIFDLFVKSNGGSWIVKIPKNFVLVNKGSQVIAINEWDLKKNYYLVTTHQLEILRELVKQNYTIFDIIPINGVTSSSGFRFGSYEMNEKKVILHATDEKYNRHSYLIIDNELIRTTPISKVKIIGNNIECNHSTFVK